MKETKQQTLCFHCGDPCMIETIEHDHHQFCCQGCKTVYSLLNETGLRSYYNIERAPGNALSAEGEDRTFLELKEVQDRFIDFSEGSQSKVTFYLPSVHCSACIWLLERLSKLNPGVIKSEVNYIRKEVTVFFRHDEISLKELVDLLSNLGYPPDLQRDKTQATKQTNKTLLLKLGIAGFAFGNIMLFSFPEYLSIDPDALGSFGALFSYLSFLLALPVLFYSATDYTLSAWRSLKVGYLTIDVPITIGIFALFARSTYEVFSGLGPGYFDSFAGLVFFLLVGKWYQSKTYSALAFDRDFKSYFPIAVNRQVADQEEVCMLEDIKLGDRLKILHNQIIPCDSVLMKGAAAIDYSFVNGEGDVVNKGEGHTLFAGGRQVGGVIEVEVVKEVSQGYLTSLWNQEGFNDKNTSSFSGLIDRVSRVFSIGILTVAFATLLIRWGLDLGYAFESFTAVLIIACPCALALSMPFAMGNVSRILGKRGFFVKNASTLERMVAFTDVVFDKTGTLTHVNKTNVEFHGGTLSESEWRKIKTVASNSTHPLSVAISQSIHVAPNAALEVKEIPGKGITALVQNESVVLGSISLAASLGLGIPEQVAPSNGSSVHVWISGSYKGSFEIEKALRRGVPELVKALQFGKNIHLISGDNDRDRNAMVGLFGDDAEMFFNQSPSDKLEYIEKLKTEDKIVLMLGDGLNDAGALKRADVGIAIADDVFSFSPACDAILEADKIRSLDAILTYIQQSHRVVKASIVISLLYNVVGLFFAVQGLLTPVVAAILMPLSSVTVVAFVSLLTSFLRPNVS